MASLNNTSTSSSAFFIHGNARQFDYVLKLYPQVLKLKAEQRNKPEELIKLDDWYQNELPKKIKQRGRDAHLIHEELVQCMKWKQSRGKYYPQLSYLIKVNTPRAVMMETKKAFRKLPNIEQALTALSNLKGVGITMASALLAAAIPENAPFMADEVLNAIPEIEGIDYTTREYLNFVTHVESTRNRLNSEGTGDEWSAHQIELAVWTHSVASELKPELLQDMPDLDHLQHAKITGTNGTSAATTPDDITTEQSDDSNPEAQITSSADDASVEPTPLNGVADSLDESSTRSEDSLDPNTPIIATDETNDSDSQSSAKRSLDSEEHPETGEPEVKKLKNDE